MLFTDFLASQKIFKDRYMTTSKRKAGRKSKNAAKKVLSRKIAKPGFPTDEESIILRRINAEKENAKVIAANKNKNDFYGIYKVESSQWNEPYTVEIRSLDKHINTCTCQDHLMNQLGTCKHIERVLQKISYRNKTRFAKAIRNRQPDYEIFLDMAMDKPQIKLLRPVKTSVPIEKILSPFFSSNGILLGSPVSAMQSIKRAIAKLSPKMQNRINISCTIRPYVEQLKRESERTVAKKSFLEDVRVGKRTLNPLLHPLYPYQQEGMLHLAFGERALLADEMGLGKTVQAIAACEILQQLRGIKRVMIVCPASLKAEWEEQIKFFTGKQAKLVYGPRAARLRTYREDYFYFITNYEQVRAEVDDINELLAPDVVILDEAQRIKNWPTKTAKTIKRLQSPYAFVLTGTPLENRIEEIYSLVEFLDPKIFGSLFRFQRAFLDVDDEGETFHKNLPELHRKVNSIMLRRRKNDVEGELPERTTKTFFVPMEEEQILRYEDYALKVAKLAAIAKRRKLRKEELERLQKFLACMRMICDTPFILDSECRISPKLEELEIILDELLSDPDTKILIFSEWVKMLELIKELAQEKGIGFAEHTGLIPQKERRIEINRFKEAPDCRLFLLSESGSAGLNLQVANVVINVDLPWNPAKLEQRIARAWRKHQTRTVSVINLVAENSIESTMLAKLAFKQQIASSVVDGIIPEDGLKSKRGSKAFLEQVDILMGTNMSEMQSSSQKTEISPTEKIKQDLTAQLPAQILEIATINDNSIMVVTKHNDDISKVHDITGTTDSQVHVEVLDYETFMLLQRLQEHGIIAFTGKAENFLQSSELNITSDTTIVRPPRFRKKALEKMSEADRKRKMTRLLVDGELYMEALLPIHDAFCTAVEALYIFCYENIPDTPITSNDVISLMEQTNVSANLTEHSIILESCDPYSDDVEKVIRDTVEIINEIEEVIKTE